LNFRGGYARALLNSSFVIGGKGKADQIENAYKTFKEDSSEENLDKLIDALAKKRFNEGPHKISKSLEQFAKTCEDCPSSFENETACKAFIKEKLLPSSAATLKNG